MCPTLGNKSVMGKKVVRLRGLFTKELPNHVKGKITKALFHEVI